MPVDKIYIVGSVLVESSHKSGYDCTRVLLQYPSTFRAVGCLLTDAA